MQVFIERAGETREMDFSGTAQQLLDSLGINRQTVLVLKDDELVPEETDISDAKDVRIITVVSGG